MLDINRIYNEDCLSGMRKIEDNSIHAIITSPPYFCNKEYETIRKDGNIYDSYNKYVYDFLIPIFKESFRILCEGGHLWINIDDSHTSIKSELKKNLVLPTHALLINELHKMFDFKEMILWRKIRGKHASGGSLRMLGSYGRFRSPGSIPIVQEVEYILWFKKGDQRTDITDEKRKESSLTPYEFKRYGMQIWDVPPERAKSIGHPAPYPIEIPSRCIKLSTFVGDIVLDPFMGAGTTALACKKNKRNYIGFELNKKYIELAERRLGEYSLEDI